MYILTNRLVSLRRGALPLPWYHRAPLGLMSGTHVHVALQPSKARPFGDLIVSVVDPENWPFVSEVSASRGDEPGVLADVYKAAPPLNIVFAEAVTVDWLLATTRACCSSRTTGTTRKARTRSMPR